MSQKIVVSRELLLLAMEHGAAKGMKDYVEGEFAKQFPGYLMNINSNVNVDFKTELQFTVDGYDLEWVE